MKEIKQNDLQRSILSKGWHYSCLGVILITLMVCIIYSPCAKNSFIWDDKTNIYENIHLKNPGGLFHIWGSFDLYQYYPLTFTSFYLEYRLWGLNPVGYHITNILLHALNAILVFFLLQELGLKRWLALFTASLFAIHPIEAETVAWATERKNLLSGVFYFTSFLFYLKFLDTEKYRSYGLSLFFFLGALLSKSVTVTLPLTLLLAEYLRGKSITRNSLLRISMFLVPGIVMGFITAYLETYRYGAVSEQWSFSALQRIIIAPRVLMFYASKIVLPINMCFIYPKWQIDPNLPWDYWPVILLLGSGAILWWTRKRITRLTWFALGHYVVSLLPASGMINFYFMRYSFVQNHFQYLAGLGIMILIGTIGMRIISRIAIDSIQSKVAVLLSSIVLIVCGFMTYNQCKIYRNNETLWRDTISKNPDAWMAHNNLGIVLNKQGKLDEGIKYFKKAIDINPNFAEAHTNLGAAYDEKGMLDEAISEYKKSLAIRPNFIDVLNNLGVAYGNKGLLDEAIYVLKKVLIIKPNSAEAHCNLGLAYDKKGRLAEAIAEYKQALVIKPRYAEAHYNLGNAYSKRGKLNEAISEFKKTLTIKPRYAKAHNNLGNIYKKRGRLDEAISEYKKELAINPNFAEAYINLGVSYHKKGELDKAISEYKRAMAIKPDYPLAHNNLALSYYLKGNYRLAIIHCDKAVELGYSVNPKLLGLLEPYR